MCNEKISNADGFPTPEIVLDRLSNQFGETAIRELVERLAVMLDESIASLDEGNGQAIAHRVAGVAGTLGFSHLGQCWLALAEADHIALDALRLETAGALAIIAERYGKLPQAKTSV